MSNKLKGGVSFTSDSEDQNQKTEEKGVEIVEEKDIKKQMEELENLKNQIHQNTPQLKSEGNPSFQVPTEKVLLPSQGKTYQKGSALHNAKEIEIRQMTASDEDVLTSRSLIRSGKVVDVLLQNCIMTKGINVGTLLPADRDAIMMNLRANSYGSDYIIDISCPVCEQETKSYEFDLKNLQIKFLEEQPDEDGLFSYTLPSNTVIKYRLLNSDEEGVVEDMVEKIKKASRSEIDKSITTRLKYQIVMINGESGNRLINSFVDSMNVRDSRALRKHLVDMSPEIIREHTFKCIHCGSSSDIEMPITAEFFFPSA